MSSKRKELGHLFFIFLWVLAVTFTGHFLGIHATWAYSLVVPVFFLMHGEVEDKLKSIFLGGTVGMMIAYIMCILISRLSHVIGHNIAYVLCLTVAIALLLLLKPFAPHVFNNVGFIYLIVGTVDTAAFCKDIIFLIGSFLIGGAIYVGGALLIIKGIRAHATRVAR